MGKIHKNKHIFETHTLHECKIRRKKKERKSENYEKQIPDTDEHFFMMQIFIRYRTTFSYTIRRQFLGHAIIIISIIAIQPEKNKKRLIQSK